MTYRKKNLIFHNLLRYLFDVADQNAMKIIKSQFPNRQIVCLDGHDILMGGGNIHCITQQQPKALL